MRMKTVAGAILLLLGTINQTAAAMPRDGVRGGGAVDAHDFGALGKIERTRATTPHLATAAAASEDVWRRGTEAFARRYAAQRGGAGNESFAVRNVMADELGQVHIRVAQTIAGLPVVGSELIVHADAKSGNVTGVNGNFAIDIDVPRDPRVAAWAAIEHAAAEYGVAADPLTVMPELTYIVVNDGSVRLAWTALVSYTNEQGENLDRIYADALSGEPVARHPQIHRAKLREVYSCSNTTTVPGTLVKNETGSVNTTDPVAIAAFDHLGSTYDYYWNVHGRNSYNAAGAAQRASVHYGVQYDGAWWNATHGTVVLGDATPSRFRPLAYAMDVVAHEFTHGVIQYSGHLTYVDEPGALNESMSDCMAAAAEAYRDGSISADTWTIGEDFYLSGTHPYMRLMSNPIVKGGVDWYPSRNPGGDVHKNSGIQSLAFYLLVTGGQHPRGLSTTSVSGIGMTAASKIFYRALTAYVASSTNYRLMREYTLQAAADLYGSTSSQRTAVANAWTAVGNTWLSYPGTMTTVGQSQTTTPFTTSVDEVFTSHLIGPASANFDVFLERFDGSNWIVVASGTGSTARETVERSVSPAGGTFRWRVQSISGTGSYQFYVNIHS